jgi:hypothetical protein
MLIFLIITKRHISRSVPDSFSFRFDITDDHGCVVVALPSQFRDHPLTGHSEHLVTAQFWLSGADRAATGVDSILGVLGKRSPLG